MSEEEKDLNVNEETENIPNEGGKEEEKKSKLETGGKKIDEWIDKIKHMKDTEAGRKNLKEWKSAIISLILIVVIGNILGGKITDIVPMRFVAVNLVKSATLVDYPDMNYEDALNSICDNQRWEYIGKHDGQYIVEYNGIYKEGNRHQYCLQFAVDKDSDYVEVVYIDIDGEVANLYQQQLICGLMFTRAHMNITAQNTNNNTSNVGNVQATAPAPTVPETEEVYNPNGEVKADSYYDEAETVSLSDEELDDLYGEGDLDVPDETTAPINEIYEPDTSNTYPELLEYPVWKDLDSRFSDTWYSEDSGLFIQSDIIHGIPVLVFSTDKGFSYDDIVYTLYPNDGNGAWAMGKYGDSQFTFQGDLVNSNSKNVGYVIAMWDDINDYTKVDVWVDSEDTTLNYPVTGYYMVMQ